MLGLGNSLLKPELNILKSATLELIGDAFVNNGFPDSNYNWANIQLFDNGESGSFFGMLKFDLAGLRIKNIKAATLKMYAEVLTDNINIAIKNIVTDWNEATATYNNKPEIEDYVYFQGDILTGTGWKEFDVTNLIKNYSAGNASYGLWLYVTDSKWCQFTSKEGTNIPVLEITYT